MYNKVLDNLIVVKRSGQRVEFNASKIALAIKSAFDSVYDTSKEDEIYKLFEKVLTHINNKYKDRKTITVEDIQNIIEEQLKNTKYKEVYNSFNQYRKKRSASRQLFEEKQQHKFLKAIEKIQENNDIKIIPQLSPYNTIYKFGRIISSEYAKSYILDTKSVRAFEEGNMFIHDIDYFSLGIISNIHLKLQLDNNLDQILSEVINAQNEVNNEIAINSLDKLLAPFILKRYKELLKNNIVSYLNLLGFQHFINISKLEQVINQETDLNTDLKKYKNFTPNHTLVNLFSQAITNTLRDINTLTHQTVLKILETLENNYQRNNNYSISTGTSLTQLGININLTLIKILKKHKQFQRVFIIFKIAKNNELIKEKIAELILNKKLVTLVFVKNSYNIGTNEVEYFSNGIRIYENENNFEKISAGRMVVSTTSINLARLGLKYKNKNIKSFYKELDDISELVQNELLLSFETIGNKNRDNYKTLFKNNVLDDEKLENNQKIRKVIKNGTLNIGLIGLKECVQSLEKTESKQYDLIIKILSLMNQKCKLYSEESKLNFGISEPTEIKSRKDLLAIDKSIYGISDITNKYSYDLIDTLKTVNNDYHKLSKIQKLFTHGQLITINLPNNISSKKVIELINKLIDEDIGFVRMKVGK